MASLVVLIVVMMVIPLPTWLLDILLSANITIGVVVLLATFTPSRRWISRRSRPAADSHPVLAGAERVHHAPDSAQADAGQVVSAWYLRRRR